MRKVCLSQHADDIPGSMENKGKEEGRERKGTCWLESGLGGMEQKLASVRQVYDETCLLSVLFYL